MGILDQVAAVINRDGAHAAGIVRAWESSDYGQTESRKAEIQRDIGADIGIGSLIARDARLARAWDHDPDGVAAASTRIDPARVTMVEDGRSQKFLANRMLYDLALQTIAKETLKENGRIRMPVEIYDLIGSAPGDRVAMAIIGLERVDREKLASGVTSGLPREFLDRAAAPLPKLDRIGSETDRRRGRDEVAFAPRSIGKSAADTNLMDFAIARVGSSAGR